MDGLFFSYLVNSDIGRSLFKSLAQGVTRYNLSKTNFNKLTIMVPALIEQKEIARILQDIELEIKSLKIKQKKLIGIKQGMMQELLTGKTRLV
jgi:type I restriction enzyme S subunit